MKKYTVVIREVWCSYRDVEANSYEDAVRKARDGDYTDEFMDYSHSPDMPIQILDENGKTLVEDFHAGA